MTASFPYIVVNRPTSEQNNLNRFLSSLDFKGGLESFTLYVGKATPASTSQLKESAYLVDLSFFPKAGYVKHFEWEFNAFNNMDNVNQKILITTDDIDFATSTVKHIKLKDFLMLEEL